MAETETHDNSTTRDTTSFADLLSRMSAGDTESVAALHHHFFPLLLARAQGILRDRGAAEEVVQDTLLQVWSQARRYDANRACVRSWLTMILTSRAIDRLRSRYSFDKAQQAFARGNAGELEMRPRGEQVVLAAERQRRLRQELSKIPPPQRQVIELAYYEGLTQSEMAARLEVPIGTIKSRISMAIRRLRLALGSEVRELL